MKFAEAPKSVIAENYANFSGRASRSEYWWWVVWAMIIGFTFGFLDGMIFHVKPGDPGVLSLVVNLGLLVPNIAVTVRRLHDVDRSGWWILIAFTLIGLIPLLYWYCKKGDDAINSFGPPPAS